MKSWILAFLLMLGFLIPSPAFAQVWAQEFYLDKNPDQLNKRWELSQWGGGGSGLISNGVKLSTGGAIHNAAAGVIWKFNGARNDGQWDGSKPSTVEFRVAVATAGNVKYGAAVTLTDGKLLYPILLSPSSMKTYRVVLNRGKASLYEEDKSDPLTEITGSPIPADKGDNNYIYFGDGGMHADGTSTWQFIRWTNAGAYSKQPASKKVDYGFVRPLNFKWLPDDSRQWKNYDNAVMITDLALSKPTLALSKQQRQKGKWKVLPYKTDEFSGNALSVYNSTNADPVKLSLNVSGYYGVYIGLSTVAGLHETSGSGVKAKLGSETAFLNLHNEMPYLDYRRDVIQEIFLTASYIKPGETLDFAQMPFTPGIIAYVRLVPLEQKEYTAWKREVAQPLFKKNIAAIDGHGMLIFNKARFKEDIVGHFRYLEHANYGKWWYQVTGADLVNYPSKIGTIPGEKTEDFSRWYDEEYVASVKGLISNGVNTLKVSREIAASHKSEFHVMLRAQGWVGSMPFEETFDSKFYHSHPEWRCVDREGTPTMHMSYAVPQVRQQMLDMFKETIEISEPDGVGILFNRGAPFILWEEAFKHQFKSKYGIDAKSVDSDDPRIHELRATIITGFLKDARTLLDSLGRKNGGKRYKLSVAVLNHSLNLRLGLDVSAWIKEGLVDDIAVAVPDMEKYAKMAEGSKSKIYPLLTPWDRHANRKSFFENIGNLYGKGAEGIGVWDADMGLYKSAVNLNQREVLRYLGNRDLINHWAKYGQPEPHLVRLTKLDDNQYSEWIPNTGF